MKNLFIIKNYYEKEGIFITIIQLINYSFRKILKINFRIKTPLDNLKNYLLKKVIKISRNKVMSGAYKNVHLYPMSNWNYHDLPTKLFGFYEKQIQEKIIEIKYRYKLTNIVNVGAGEGYHIVSLIKNNYFKNGYAFEIDKKSQLIIYKNLVKNRIKNRVKIFDEGNYNSISSNIDIKRLGQTFFLIDIEGGEFFFFNKKNIHFFNKSYFIIEMHNISQNYLLYKKFYNLVNKNFVIEKIDNTSRNPFELSNKNFDKFTDDERFLLMSEGRSEKQIWLTLIPKKN